jgi:hypothetical protein
MPMPGALQHRFPRPNWSGDAAEAVAQVAALVEQPAQGLDLPLDMQGTAFQQRVWQALRAFRRATPSATPSWPGASVNPQPAAPWPGPGCQSGGGGHSLPPRGAQ